MARVVGLTRSELLTREQVFEGLTSKAVRMTTRVVTANLDKILTAAPTLTTADEKAVSATWNHYVDAELFPYLAQTFVESAGDVYSKIDGLTDADIPKVDTDFAVQYLRQAANRLKGIGDVIWSNMREQLAEGYDAGETTQQLATRMRAVASISEPRALMIARTEIVPAANFASLHQVQLAGFTDDECQKGWIDTNDERTRPAHVEADGQRVGLSQPFKVGGELLNFPGDWSLGATANNVISCRCSIDFYFDDDVNTASGFDEGQKRDFHGRWTMNPFTILPKSERGKSGDGMYAPGMWGKYGAAGLMMRHVDKNGTARYLAVQRANPGGNQWKWQLPGGALEERETPSQGAAREVFEELGFDQAKLDALTPRGVHAIKRPVEGKEPWQYSNITADAPEMWQPKVDRSEGELWKAVWLTEDQLLEMRGRDQLVKPFADNFEKILAKFDASSNAQSISEIDDLGFKVTNVPKTSPKLSYNVHMTAAAKHHVNAPDPNWDETKVKRDTEGKFAKNLTGPKPSSIGTGQVAVAAKPIHINTNVIYKQKYADGVVVSMWSDGDYRKKLTWNENTKKFELHVQTSPSQPWKLAAVYGKGEAYKKFSKETGWYEPTSAPVSTPSSLNVGDVDTFEKFDTLSDIKKVAWLLSLSPKDLEKFSPDDVGKLEVVADDLHIKGDLSKTEYEVVAESILDFSPSGVTTPAASTDVQPFTVPDFENSSDYDISKWYENLTQDQYDSLSLSDQVQVKNDAYYYDALAPAGASYSDKLAKFDSAADEEFNGDDELISSDYDLGDDDAPVDLDAELIDQIGKMDPGQFTTWFGDYATDKDQWDGLSPTVQDTVRDFAESLAAFFGIDGPKNTIAFHDKSIGSTPSVNMPEPYVDLPSMSKDEFNSWFFSKFAFDKPKWDTLDQGDRNAITQVAHDKADKSTLDLIKSWLIKDMTPGQWNTYSPEQKSAIENDIDIFEGQDILTTDDVMNFLKMKTAAAGGGFIITPSAAPNVSNPPSPPKPTTGSKYHVDVHSKITPISDIGVPVDNGSHATYHMLSPNDAVAMQKFMLSASGKKLTPDQVNAVQRYTTSVGYRSTNAVLRDDTAQMSKLSDADLKAGVKNAVDLQNAMTKLTQNARVFRGTGAHAFGQKGIHANFSQLKKLEGKTITDEGFMSTTVLDKPDVSYDYAKKPIQMIVDVPAGAPALYVSAVTPGWSAENELILGAGTTYKLNEVREATAADKAQFGSHVKHVVHVQVVPSTGKGSHAIKSPTDAGKTPKPKASVTAPAAPAPPTAPASTIPVKTKPIKLNTNVIYKTKYSDGAVVAVKPESANGEPAKRLIWSESKSKFILQEEDVNGKWTWSKSLTKKDTYEIYGKNTYGEDTGWVEPQPGETGFGTPPFGGTLTAPPTPTPTISNTAPAPSSAPLPVAPSHLAHVPNLKMNAAMLKAMHSDVANTSPFTKDVIYNAFKTGFGHPTHLGTPPEYVFQKMVNIKQSQPGVNFLEILQIVDEKSTPAGATNLHKYESKIVAWLQTPSGTATASVPTYVPGTIPTNIVISPDGVLSHAVKPHSPAVVEQLAKVKKPQSIGKIDPSDTNFAPITPGQANTMQSQMLLNEPWTTGQKTAITGYTGSGYNDINGVLRNNDKIVGLSEDSKVYNAKKAATMQNGMRPLPKSILVYRKTNTNQFPGVGDTGTLAQIKAFEGKLFTDEGFFSTSVVQGTWSGKVHTTVEVPKGVPAAWVKQISAHKEENELILAAGLKYRVISVTAGVYNSFDVRLRVEM